jgi:flagellar basal-body rod protein FlgB
MNAVPQYDSLKFNETALKLRTFRQEILSNNLANSDTPGFKARDIRFADVLKAQMEGTLPSMEVSMATTHSGHIAGKITKDDPRLLYRVPNQPAKDGNTVDSDVELSEFTKNSVLTEATLGFLSGTLRGRMSAITGQAS